MPPPKKTHLRDIDKEDRVSARDAIDFEVDPRSTPSTNGQIIVRRENRSPYPDAPVPMQSDLATAESAIEWVEEQVLKATPRAIQEVIHQMKTGETKGRLAAALQILDRAGVQAKDKAPTVVAPVFVLTKDAMENIPWVKRAQKAGKIVDGQIVTSSAEVIANAKKDR